MAVTLQQVEWFRKVKLLVLLQPNQSVSLVHSLHLRTFHVGGVAGGNIATSSNINAKYDGMLEIDELRYVEYTSPS